MSFASLAQFRWISQCQPLRSSLVPWLEKATLAYLLVPNLIFAFGWLRWYVAIPVIAALVAGFAWSWKQSKTWRDPSWKPLLGPERFSAWLLPGLLLIAAFWTWISGIGGYQFYTGDWDKHFSVLNSLIQDSWPPAEHPSGRDYHWPICYYFAYYLPAAVAGQLAGWKTACFALYLWTVLGLFLSLLWLALLTGKRPLLAAAIFPLLGGLDWFAQAFWTGHTLPGREHLEWWSGWLTWEYASNQTLMSWVPQHALPCWLALGWIMHEWLEGKGLGRAGLLAGLLPLWAPLVFVGLVPFALMGLLLERGRRCLTLGNFLGIAPALVAILMLVSHATPIPQGFYWEFPWVESAQWLNVGFFILMEVGLIALFTDEFFRPTVPKFRPLGIVCLIVLLLTPLYVMGMYNDFSMRASQPALFILWIFVLRSLFHHPAPATRPLLVLVTVMGTFGVWGGWTYALDTPLGRTPPEQKDVPLLYGIEWPVAKQYHGNPESFFFKYLAKPFEVGPHVPVIPWPPGMWISPEEEKTPRGYPQRAKKEP